MGRQLKTGSLILMVLLCFACKDQTKTADKDNTVNQETKLTAADILGNPDYTAISYGGYRKTTREAQPTVAELKEDMKILAAMGIGIIRTYNVQLPHASNVLKAIRELKQEDPNF